MSLLYSYQTMSLIVLGFDIVTFDMKLNYYRFAYTSYFVRSLLAA